MGKLIPYHNPNMVRAMCPIPKGELKLAPASQKVSEKAASLSIAVCEAEYEDSKVALYLNTQHSPPLDAHGKDNPSKWMCFFWWVNETTEKKKVNMELVWVCDELGAFKIYVPMLTNIVDIEKGDELLRMRSNGAITPFAKEKTKKLRTS